MPGYYVHEIRARAFFLLNCTQCLHRQKLPHRAAPRRAISSLVGFFSDHLYTFDDQSHILIHHERNFRKKHQISNINLIYVKLLQNSFHIDIL